MKIIVGLGNPGAEYERHRHNIGFQVVEALASRHRLALTQKKFDADIAHGAVRGEKVLLVLPQTFMNRSGDSVAPAMRFYKVEPADVLVVYDELDLPFERLVFKGGGGAGGHNGVRSMIERTGGDGFARLRFGIGKPDGPNAKDRVVGHVLGGFNKDENARLPDLIGKAVDMAEDWLALGLGPAMNRHNRSPDKK